MDSRLTPAGGGHAKGPARPPRTGPLPKYSPRLAAATSLRVPACTRNSAAATWSTHVAGAQFRRGYSRWSAEFIRWRIFVTWQFHDPTLSQAFDVTVGLGTDRAHGGNMPGRLRAPRRRSGTPDRHQCEQRG